MAVLDTMIQPLEGEPNTYFVYYHILDGDQSGRAPNCEGFDRYEKSCLYKIAKNNDKVIKSMHLLQLKLLECLFRW